MMRAGDQENSSRRGLIIGERPNGPGSSMKASPHSDPLHGVTLERMVTELEARYGWAELGELIRIRCFRENPSVSSSLKFLRKTPWARAKVEDLYVWMQGEMTP